jgi:hypothetical protein
MTTCYTNGKLSDRLGATAWNRGLRIVLVGRIPLQVRAKKRAANRQPTV